jgi:hypothetical protein
MSEDVFFVEITEDGIIKSTTPKISAANHSSANEFFKVLSRMTGGESSSKKRIKTTAQTTAQTTEQKHQIKGEQ